MKVNEIEPKNDDPKTLIASSFFNELVRPKISFPIKLIDQNKKTIVSALLSTDIILTAYAI